MPRHHDALVSFDVPRDWDDRTIIAYRAPVEGEGRAPNLVMTRDRLGEDEDFVEVQDEPGAVGDLFLQLARPPSGVADERSEAVVFPAGC